VETFPVEKSGQKFFPKCLWKDGGKFHNGVWNENPCGTRKIRSYPHNFSLILLILPKLLSEYIYYKYISRKELEYAFYL
jgi:hypothetical protein